jgi:hypothetical protein
MTNRSRFWVNIILIGGLLMVTTEYAVGAPKPKPKPKSPPPPAVKGDPDETKDKPAIESDQLKSSSYHGLLVSTPNEGGLFRVAVEYERVRVKPGKEAEYDRIQKDSIKQAAAAADNQTKAGARAQLTPTLNGELGFVDRGEISGALGTAAGSAARLMGENAQLKGLLDTVRDTQTVIFHAAPKIQVRVLKPSDKPHDSTLSTSQSEVEEVKKKKDKIQLPGYEGAMTDLKVGQRVLLKLAPANNDGNSIYKRLVTLVVVEEEAQPSKSSK